MPVNQPTKILYLITLSELGGAQKYLFDLAVFGRRQGFDVSVAVGGSATGELISILTRSGFPVFYLHRLQRTVNLKQDLLAFFDLLKLLRQIKPDIIHLNSSKAGSLGALAAKIAGIKKIIYTIHGLVLNEPLTLTNRIFYWLSEWFSALFKDHLICVSDFDRKSLLKNKICPAKKITVIHNGVEPANLTFYPRAEARAQLSLFSGHELSPSDFIVGTIANFYPTKGLGYLIEAAAEVTRIHDQVKFVLIGDGPLAPQLRQSVNNYHLDKRVIFTGALPAGSTYLQAFDLFVFPSLKEGLAYALLEAAAAGLPIVATNVGGNPEVITNDFDGLLIPPADIGSLASTLINLIPDKDRLDRYAYNSQIRVKEFSLQNMLTQTFKLYFS